MSLEYLLEFAGTPFLIDVAKVVRLPVHGQGETDDAPGTPKDQLPPRKHQPLADLVDEIDRILPFKYLNDFKGPNRNPGRNLGAIAYTDDQGPMPNPQVRIGDWFYPTGASRWSVFRGLATSAMVRAMLAVTQGSASALFRMKANPISPDNPTDDEALYTLESYLFMLPPRPIGEHGGAFDGLYLVTLVDERWYWQGDPVSLKISKDTTWASLISQLGTALGIIINHTAISAAYGQPEPDSQLWTNQESAAVLLDAVAHNVGRVFVRSVAGAYDLMTPAESRTTALASRRANDNVARIAGGDIFNSGSRLPVGSLVRARSAIVPSSVTITFPKYVRGNDPVPHYLNARYANQRPSCWYEESYGDTHNVNIPIASGAPPLGSGLIGQGDYFIHTTAKALYETETAVTGDPINQSGLNALALQLANDYYSWQDGMALDEVYPGTYAWNPEGFHDIVWTYSARARQAATRVLRAEWNQTVREMQHSAPAMSGYSNVIQGVGGPSVPQTWRDSISGHTVTLGETLDSGSFTATMLGVDNLPTQNRWKGRIDGEDILFEGTSGGLAVGIVYRWIDGTIQVEHDNVSTVTEIRPHTVYGANLVTTEKMQWFFPGAHTSGGTQEVVSVPQTQTVRVLSASGQTMGGIVHYSGEVSVYSPATGAFPSSDRIWVRERNDDPVISGRRYDGQFVGFSLSGPISPVYLVNVAGSGLTGGGTVLSGTLQWFHFVACGVSGINCSGYIFNQHLASGAVNSGKIASGILQWWHFAQCSLSGIDCSGYIFSQHLSVNAVVSGKIASGSLSWFHFAQCSLSGIDCSGFIFNKHLASGPAVDWYNITVDAIRSGLIDFGGVSSGDIASGLLTASQVNAGGGLDWHAFTQAGSGTRGECWFATGTPYANPLTFAFGPVSGFVYALPFLIDNSLTANKVAIHTGGANIASGKFRIAIHRNNSQTDLYPGSLLTGTSGAINTANISQVPYEANLSGAVFTPGLYWVLLYVGDALANTELVGTDFGNDPWPLSRMVGFSLLSGIAPLRNRPAGARAFAYPGDTAALPDPAPTFSLNQWSSGANSVMIWLQFSG